MFEKILIRELAPSVSIHITRSTITIEIVFKNPHPSGERDRYDITADEALANFIS